MAEIDQTVFQKSNRRRSYKENSYLYDAGRSKRIVGVTPFNGIEEKSLSTQKLLSTKYSTIESVIMNPICCGYLLLFCECQHNSENVRFFLEVDALRDMFAADKKKNIWIRRLEL
jgi:hypothetical protein